MKTSLLQLVAADRREYKGFRPTPHFRPAEQRILDRYARAVRDGKYVSAVAAVAPCRAELLRLRRTHPDSAPDIDRTRQSVHRALILHARKLGRPRLRIRWQPEERQVLERFADAVAQGKYPTARGAGRACAVALKKLHERKPTAYAGIHDRTEATIQHVLWPMVAKRRFRWFNSNWDKAELDILDDYARKIIAHEYDSIMAASHDCVKALAEFHRKRNPRGPAILVRGLPGVFSQLRVHAIAMDRFQLPNRPWEKIERKVAKRWARTYLEGRKRGRRMSLDTAGGMMLGELSRLGYFRTQQACVAEIWYQCAEGRRTQRK